MRRFFGRLDDDNILIEGDDFVHLKSVLRLNVGEEVEVSVGDEYFYSCQILELKKNHAVCSVIEKTVCKANPKIEVAVFMATPKGDKAELVLQKITELGVSKFILFDSDFAFKKGFNTERLTKITREACKQCGRSSPVGISGVLKFSDMLKQLNLYKQVIFANEKGGAPLKEVKILDNIAIIVGAEGGFSVKEIEALEKLSNVKAVTLGKRILRCETAAIALSAYVSFI